MIINVIILSRISYGILIQAKTAKHFEWIIIQITNLGMLLERMAQQLQLGYAVASMSQLQMVTENQRKNRTLHKE